MAQSKNPTTTTNHQLHQRLTPQWQQDLTQLPHSHAIIQLLGERILPNIQPDGPTPTPAHSTDDEISAAVADSSPHSLPLTVSSHSSNPNVFVENLPRPISEHELTEWFSPYGQVSCVHIVTDKLNPTRQKGFAFISFEDPQSGTAAIAALNETEKNGRVIRCSVPKNKLQSGNTPARTNTSSSRPSLSSQQHLQSLPPPRTDGPAAIRQLRELFKPQMRCNRTTPTMSPNDQAPATDLVERWIFQLNDHTTTTAPQSITTPNQVSTVNQLSTTSLTISPSVQDVLCDLFHPLMVSTERTRSVTVTESKLNEPMMVDGDDDGDKESGIADGDKNHLQLGSQHAPTCISVSPYVTLMDLIIELYSTCGLCRRHENLCHQYLESPTKLKISKEVHLELFNLQELCSMPHRLWMSWSKNQRPLLEPFIQTHLIPDLANITLEYLLGNEFTIPIQIDRKPQPTYRWRFPLREWRRDDQNHGREFSPQFEIDGEKWRLLCFPGGNPNHMVPNCLAVYLELRDQPTYYNVVGHFKFRMVHPTDPTKSIWRDTTHIFTNYEVDRGFNDLLTPTTIDEFTHPSDECVVLEVAAWTDPHLPLSYMHLQDDH